jgi:hypothetical protein
MQRRLVIPKPISETIRSFGLSRNAVVSLFTRIHSDIVQKYEIRRHARTADPSLYRHILLVHCDGTDHLFTLAIDDTTSNEHLIISDLRHTIKP